ncbi:uncharacterized protein A1O5_01453 [Cladophialophora psammophila CBS 110553]|uniref:G domain-containing protein n=1 Tax=Cladophialophora psammophila CBS 110553 TaxID=1182543 RepID=W9X3H4_9EURO|nr:uncharacterized protein A1O5_01453 [Cladophialophora psammophila CBS 110553]EXJ74758.1 hypothetical protein A1O5_01453 [Cladophialophora psammophila CBS 110553]
MGMTGVGKSSFIQLFTPDTVGVGDDLESFTTQVAIFPCKMPNSDESFYLVDTPGFDDSNRPDQEILRELSSWLTKTYSENIRLSGIIYLHRIIDVRFSGAAMRNLSMFKKLCGDGNLASVVLATTFWAKVDEKTGREREDQLKTTPAFWGNMVNRGSQVFRHDFEEQSGSSIIQYLLDRRDKPVYAIQDEMVNKKKTLEETAAGSEVQAEMDKMRRKYEQMIVDIKQEMQEHLKNRDEAARQALEAERKEREEFIRRELEERKKMQAQADALWDQREAEREKERQEHMRRLEAMQKQYLEMQLQAAKAKTDAEHQRRLAELQKQIEIAQVKNEALERSRFSVRAKSFVREFVDFFR